MDVRTVPRDHDRRFEAAYAVALVGSLLASWLTIVYVGGEAVPESNPVTRTLIGSVGLAGTIALRTAAVPVLYWGYSRAASVARSARLGVAFAWLGAVVNAADAAGNVFAALLLGPAPYPMEHLPAAAVVLALTAFAVVARPRCVSPTRGAREDEGF